MREIGLSESNCERVRATERIKAHVNFKSEFELAEKSRTGT